ncbi:Transferrin receptor protein 1 [Labeo rohita]|uniref:Transferrin receptor protein 1 n=2 Tax=Labeo rohita TaxID=84645 RepID=A0ABQ8LGZ3_LABRO|nr:Transferrin receptor protein 1 [Labeo rohita]
MTVPVPVSSTTTSNEDEDQGSEVELRGHLRVVSVFVRTVTGGVETGPHSMAGTIDQAKMKFSRIVNSRSYTLFNQSQNPDGESSRVEVKLAVDGEEEMDETEQGHMRRETYTRSSRSAPWNKRRILVWVCGVLVVFCVGILIGYSTHRESEPPSCSAEKTVTQKPDFETVPNEEVYVPALDWSDLVGLLNDKLSSKAIEDNLSEYSQGGREAGSYMDNKLADNIHNTFTQLNMNPWVDEHFVKLQFLDRSKPNKVLFGSKEIGPTAGFLAYSETGTKEGRVVYVNYGELSDLQTVQNGKYGLNLNGSVLLMRAGKISMAQKVMNAAKIGAVAVLIYPDAANYKTISETTALYGHVHLGSGDPYTPGFPSFNHTQFPPAKSSGLPGILAQTITAKMAETIFKNMGGDDAPEEFRGALPRYKLGSQSDNVTVEVNNKLAETKIHNVFGVIKGYVDPDRYVVIGAQRDSLTNGYAKSAVGTTLLMELARVFTELKKDGFKPKRSIVFASWTAGDFGNIGVTEWLEGYWSSLDRKACTYISLDGVVTGAGSFRASASPLLHTLLQKTLEKLKTPGSTSSLLQSYGGVLSNLLTPMQMDDGAYPFLALSGIPSVSFSFVSSPANAEEYLGTDLDEKDHLDRLTSQKVLELSMLAAQVAGQIALRLVHDHILRLDVTKYTDVITNHVNAIIKHVDALKKTKVDKIDSLSTQWLNSARGSYSRAATSLNVDIKNTDTNDMEMCRIINNRIMKVEHNFLSPYFSLRDVPFRHIFFGSGGQTATDLEKYLGDVVESKASFNIDQVLNDFALLTWTIQGCANDLAGDIWSLDNEI